jgi:hypothetical protein
MWAISGGKKRGVLLFLGVAISLTAVCWRVMAETPGKVPVPVYGAYFGIAPADNDPFSKISDLETTIGRGFDVHRVRSDQANPNILANNSPVQDAIAHNRIPWLSIKMGRWDQVASGVKDNQIDNLAERVKQLGHPIFLTVNYEPEDETATNYTTADYVAAWRRYHNRFAEAGVTNVSWGFVVKATSLDPNDGLYANATAMYPGDDYVDWIGVDSYNMLYDLQAGYDHCKNNEKKNESKPKDVADLITNRSKYPCQSERYTNEGLTNNWRDLDERLGAAYSWVTTIKPGEHDVPMAVTEWGSTYDWREPARRAEWIASAKEDLKAIPAVKLVAYANTPEWELAWPSTENPGDDRNAFRAMGEDPYYRQDAPEPDTEAPTVVLDKPTSGTYAGLITAEATAIDNEAVHHVAFVANDTWLFTDYEAPYTYERNTTSSEDGEYAIRAMAYDAAGNVGTSESSTIVVDNFATEPPRIDSFVADPAEIVAGDYTALSWTVTNVGSCSVNPDGPQDTSRTTWQTPPLTNPGVITYTLTCANQNGSTSKQTSVTVTPVTEPPEKPFFNTNASEVKPGGSALLSWSSANAKSCELNPGKIIAEGETGSELVTDIRQTTTFTLVCRNDAGSINADPVTVTVTKDPQVIPQIVKFAFEPPSIENGHTSVLISRTAGVASNGCSVTGTPYYSLSGNFDVITPPLYESMTVTEVCNSVDGQIVSASAGISVDGVPPPPPPPAVPPSPQTQENVATARTATTDQTTGVRMVNVQRRDKVIQGELIVLTPALMNEDFAAQVEKVEYYEEEKLIETVTEPPFGLDSNLIEPGEHTITERIYMLDGIIEQRSQQITVYEKPPIVIFGTLAAVITGLFAASAFLVYHYTPAKSAIQHYHTRGSKK